MGPDGMTSKYTRQEGGAAMRFRRLIAVVAVVAVGLAGSVLAVEKGSFGPGVKEADSMVCDIRGWQPSEGSAPQCAVVSRSWLHPPT